MERRPDAGDAASSASRIRRRLMAAIGLRPDCSAACSSPRCASQASALPAGSAPASGVQALLHMSAKVLDRFLDICATPHRLRHSTR